MAKDGISASHAPKPRTGGQLVVDTLAKHGVRQAFCVPGESYLPVLDAFVDHPEIA